MCDVPRRTPCMAWSAAEPHATRWGGYGVLVRAALLESAFGLLLSALPKPPASLRAPSRNADPAGGGPEPQRIGALLQRPYRTSVASTTTEGRLHTERSFFYASAQSLGSLGLRVASLVFSPLKSTNDHI